MVDLTGIECADLLLTHPCGFDHIIVNISCNRITFRKAKKSPENDDFRGLIALMFTH